MNSRNESEMLMSLADSGTVSAVAVCPETLRRRRLTWVTLFFAAGLVAAMSTQAMGQKYEVLKLNPAIEEETFFKRMTSTAKAYSQAREISKVKNAVYAQRYFQQYIPIKITQPDAVGEISKLLDFAQARLEGAQRQGLPQANQMLVWLYSGLKPIAVGNYAPPARINAILFIAKMNEKAAVRGQAVPVPIRKVPSVFLPIYLDAKNPDGVRAAALVGLHRYATILGPAMDAAERAALDKAMQDLLKSKTPEGRSEESHAYLQRFAVDILASTKGDPNLGKTLVSISTETKKHDLIALHAAAQLASNSGGLAGVKPDAALSGWAVRAMRSFQFEIARLNALDGPRPASAQPVDPDAIVGVAEKKTAKTTRVPGGAMGGMGGMGGMYDGEDATGGMDDMEEEGMGMEMMGGGMYSEGPVSRAKQPPEVDVSRRKLNYMLQQLHLGATGSGTVGEPKTPAGLLAAVDDSGKEKVIEWLTKMEEVVNGLNDPTLGSRDKYIVALDEQVKLLQELAGPAAAAAAAEIGISLPGHAGPVAITAEPKIEGDVVDKAGAPKFPVGLDELAPAE